MEKKEYTKPDIWQIEMQNYLHLLIGSEESTQQLPIYDDEMDDEENVM